VLLRRRVPIRCYVSIERDPNARRVCRANYTSTLGERLQFAPELRQLSPKLLRSLGAWPPHLVFGSTPCSDLSGIRRGREALPLGGLGGPTGLVALLFARKVDELRAAKRAAPFALVFENVSSMLAEAREALVEALRLPAFDCDAAVWEAAHRKRLFATNLPLAHVPAGTADRRLQQVLSPPAMALTTKACCIRTGGSQGLDARAGTAAEIGRRLKMTNLVLCSAHTTDVRGLLIHELAAGLGLPAGEVDAASGGDTAKRGLLGRGLADGQVGFVLGELVRRMRSDESDDDGAPHAPLDVRAPPPRPTQAAPLAGPSDPPPSRARVCGLGEAGTSGD
jgi:hypothetical protein